MSTIRPALAVFALTAVLLAVPGSADAAAMDEITAHNKAGKTVFLVLTDAAAKNLKAARETAQAAAKQVPGAAIVELNRSDPKQAAAVKKYRVAAAPVPLVLVVAPNGVAVGGSYIKKGAVQRLVSLVPTPAKADYLRVLSQGQTACVIFSHSKMAKQSDLFMNVTTVVQQTNGKVTPVLVDVTKKSEARFLKEWKIDPKATEPTVILMNPKGLTLGRLKGAPSVAQIIATSKKKPCCGDPGCKGCQ